jgi:hypothetical protein
VAAPDTRHSPSAAEAWDLHWDQGRLLLPGGKPLDLQWAGTPDMAAAHAAVDAWAAAAHIVGRLPAPGGFPLWWILRVKMVHTHLCAWLPVLRGLRALEAAPARIRLHGPPAPWWPDLLRVAFPDAEIRVVFWPRRDLRARLRQIGARALRALTTARRLRRVSARVPGRVRVLAVSRARAWDGRRDTEIDGVLRALQARGADVIVLDQAHEGFVASLRGWRTRPRDHLFGDYLFFDCARRHGCLPCCGAPPDLGDTPDLFAGGFALGPLFRAQLQREAASFFQGHSVYLDAVPRLAARLGIEVVLTTDETGAELGLVQGCKAAGLPVVALQHGCIHPDHLAYIFPPGTPPETVPLCDTTCVYGPHYARLLGGGSIYAAGRIRVTGQPQADGRGGEAARTEGARLRAAHLPAGCDRLLLLSSQELLADYLRDHLLPALAASDPRHFLVVRPHPREWDTRAWDRAIAAHGLAGRVLVCAGAPLDPWLAACDVHLAATSTTLAEATMMDRPNILLGRRALGDWMACHEAGVAVDLEDFPNLDAAVAHWLDAAPDAAAEQARRRADYVAAHFGPADGGASGRVADAVLDAAARRAP